MVPFLDFIHSWLMLFLCFSSCVSFSSCSCSCSCSSFSSRFPRRVFCTIAFLTLKKTALSQVAKKIHQHRVRNMKKKNTLFFFFFFFFLLLSSSSSSSFFFFLLLVLLFHTSFHTFSSYFFFQVLMAFVRTFTYIVLIFICIYS